MFRQIWHATRFFAAARVRTRDELDSALRHSPRFIIVEGTEALRAYAASLAYRGGQEAAALESASAQAGPAYLSVPTVGRIRDGYRQRPGPVRHTGERRREKGRRTDRVSLQAGMGTVIAAFTALIALLGAEWLLWPSSTPELVRGPHRVVQPPRRGDVVALPTHAPLAPPLTLHEQVIRVLVPLLVLAAVCAILVLIWQTIGPGRPVRLSWRVAYRVPGQLVIARVRTKTA